MAYQIALRIPDEDVKLLDKAVSRGRFRNRTAAIREGLREVLRQERDAEIDDAYRRAYKRVPQEEWMASDGLALLDAYSRAEGDVEPL